MKEKKHPSVKKIIELFRLGLSKEQIASHYNIDINEVKKTFDLNKTYGTSIKISVEELKKEYSVKTSYELSKELNISISSLVEFCKITGIIPVQFIVKKYKQIGIDFNIIAKRYNTSVEHVIENFKQKGYDPNKMPFLSIEGLIKLHRQDKTFTEVAKICGVSKNLIMKRFKEASFDYNEYKISAISIEKILNNYKFGVPLKEVAKRYSVSVEDVKTGFKKAGYDPNNLPKIDINVLIEENKNGTTLEELSKKYNISVATISIKMKEAGYSINSSYSRVNFNIYKLIIEHQQGTKIKELAEKYGVSQSSVSRHFKKVGYNARYKKMINDIDNNENEKLKIESSKKEQNSSNLIMFENKKKTAKEEIKKLPLEKIKDEYLIEKKGLKFLSKKYNVSPSTIKKKLNKEFGLFEHERANRGKPSKIKTERQKEFKEFLKQYRQEFLNFVAEIGETVIKESKAIQ
ncbi:MAG: hypothetical protein ACOCQR_01670 [bacterium]